LTSNLLNAEDLGIDNNMGTMASANLASHYDSGTTLPTMVNDSPGAQVNSVEPDDRKNLHNEQWGLFQTLKPAVSSICEVLHLKVCILFQIMEMS